MPPASRPPMRAPTLRSTLLAALQHRTRTAAVAAVVALALSASVVNPTLSAFPGANGKIAFIRQQLSSAYVADIWTMNPDGSDQQQLTFFPVPCDKGYFLCGSPQDVTWSPDGRHLAYSRTSTDNFHVSLVTMDADGSNVVQVSCGVFDDPSLECSDGAFKVDHLQPSWSPDGTKLVYQRRVLSENGQIYVTPLGSLLSSPGTALTAPPGDSEYPVWSPDGTRIAFIHFVG
jgi:Tol biopolymer transport system component